MIDYTWAASAGAGAICLGAGSISWMKWPRSATAAMFLLAMLSVFVSMTTGSLYSIIDQTNTVTTDAIAKGHVISTLLGMTFLLGITLVFPLERKISFRPLNSVAVVLIAGVVAAFVVGSMTVSVEVTPATTDLSQDSQSAMAAHLVILVVLATVSGLVSRQKAGDEGKRSSTIFLVGLWILAVSGSISSIDAVGPDIISKAITDGVMVTGVALAGLLFAFSIARGQMVMAVPAQEKLLSSSKAKYRLLQRLVYLVVEPKPDFAFRMFTDVLKGRCTDCANDDSFPCESLACSLCKLPCPCRECKEHKSRPQGLIVTRQFPHEVRSKYFLQTTPIIWLSSVAGNDNMDPAKLSLLTDSLVNFMEKSQNGIVLVDGLEYLATSNDFSRLLKAVDRWSETAMASKSVLIMSVDGRSFDPKELAIMERNREVVQPDAPKTWMIIPERI
jgi:hypothetical protein